MGPDGSASFGAESPSVAYNPTANEYLVVWTATTTSRRSSMTRSRSSASGSRAAERRSVAGSASPSRAPTATRLYAEEPSVAYDRPRTSTWSLGGRDGTSEEFEICGQRLSLPARRSASTTSASPTWARTQRELQRRAPSVATTRTRTSTSSSGPATTTRRRSSTTSSRSSPSGSPRPAAEIGTNDFRVSEHGPGRQPDFGRLDAGVAYNRPANEYWSPGGRRSAPHVGQRVRDLRPSGCPRPAPRPAANDFRISDMGPALTQLRRVRSRRRLQRRRERVPRRLVGRRQTAPLVDGEFEIFGQRLTATGPRRAQTTSASPSGRGREPGLLYPGAERRPRPGRKRVPGRLAGPDRRE